MSLEIDQRAVEALLRGQGCATSLKTLLQNPKIGSVSTESLLDTILDSFSLVLSFMDSPNSSPHHHNYSSSRNIAVHLPLNSSSNIKIRGVKDTERFRDDPTLLEDDGFMWRKYGQKTIITSKHQRSYYRCTYAKDRNCKAVKRVQQIKDNPPVYRTTYVNNHVCKVAVTDDTYGSKMIRFDQAVSDLVMPQLESVDVTIEDNITNHNMPYVMSDLVSPQLDLTDNQTIAMEDEVTNDFWNFLNDILMEDEQFSVSQALSSPEDMFFDKFFVSD